MSSKEILVSIALGSEDILIGKFWFHARGKRHKGWRLSPAYDINPPPLEIAPRILTTSIDFYDNSASLETAMRVAKDFRLKKEEALSIIAVKQWRSVASEFGLSKRECDRMSSAFVWEEN